MCKYTMPNGVFSNRFIFTTLLVVTTACSPALADPVESASRANSQIQKVLNSHCISCHREEKQKGQVRLDNFTGLRGDEQNELLDRVEEQIFLGKMPPKEKNPLPEAERTAFFGALKNRNAILKVTSGFREKLKKPGYGNYVDHDQLFSGEFKDLKGFTYDRQWLISEYIFNEKLNALMPSSKPIRIGAKSYVLRGRPLAAEFGNPFLLPSHSGVRYFASEELNSGHFLAMVDVANHLADVMIGDLRKKIPNYLPAVGAIAEMSDRHGAILATRRDFLAKYIDDLCLEIYKEQNEALLPTYTKIGVDGEINPESDPFGKNGWRNRIGAADGDAIVLALKKFEHKSQSKKEMIDKCERFWFHSGETPETVQRRLNTLKKELTSVLNHKNYQSLSKNEYKPLDGAEMATISATIKEIRTKSMPYQTLVEKCMTRWSEEFQQARKRANAVSDDMIATLVDQLYQRIYERSPTKTETAKQSALLRSYIAKLDVDGAVRKLTQTLVLSTEFICRNEYGEGAPDQYGRRMMSSRNASFALAYALTDSSPDESLTRAAREGKLNTREDYRREVLRLLKDDSNYYIIDNVVHAAPGVESLTNTPIRKLRFFREFFGYPKMLSIFKDEKRFGHASDSHRERLVAEADMLVDRILRQDRNVFEELLTTEKFYVFHNGDDAKMLEYAERLKKPYHYFKNKNWREFKSFDDLIQHRDFLAGAGMQGVDLDAKDAAGKKKSFDNFMEAMTDVASRFAGDREYIAPYGTVRFSKPVSLTRLGDGMRGANVSAYFNIDRDKWDYSPQQPAKVDNRKGLLTHPAWLMAHAQNTQTDPVVRGRWVREKLLAGVVPDVPITVDAVIPEDHTRTLRQRLAAKTQDQACWKCHKLMNPLGSTFEIFDDFGRYRTQEELEHPENVLNAADEKRLSNKARQTFRLRYKTLPVDASGVLDGTGDDKLDGDVKDAFDLIDRLSQAKRVRQAVIRHAFRYFMGRNETLSDSRTLMDADEAYLKSGGSFNAVIVSLLTSDSFIYRKSIEE